MKNILILFFLIQGSFIKAQTMTKTIYDFKVKDLYGEEFDFSTLKGKKIMIVNTDQKI